MKQVIPSLLALVAAATLCPAASTIVAYYQMGELEVAGGAVVGGTPATLLASTGTNLTVVIGTPAIGNTTPLPGSSYYINFDGTQRYHATPSIAIGQDDWMMEAWARPQAGGDSLEFIMANGHGGAGQALNYDAALNRYGWFVGGVGQFNGTVAATGVGTAWDHLALVRTGGLTTLYVNGVSAGSDAALGTTPFVNGSGIGDQHVGGVGFHGDIDEVYFSTVSSFNSATDLHAIPETSAALLSAFGTLGLLRRRR